MTNFLNKLDLKTGDILLCDYNGNGCMGCFTKIIKCVTKSKFSHVAMILKDPSFINPELKGLYIWESSWEGKPDPQDGIIKLGVQITPLKEIYDDYKSKKSHMFIRKLHHNIEITNEELEDIHKVVYSKPYDLVLNDWIEELTGKDSKPQKTSRFWCSALIGYIYTKLGLLKPNTDWSFLRASDFSTKSNKLRFTNGCYLDNQEIQIL